MKCRFCGAEIPNDSTFCEECGRSLTDSDQQTNMVVSGSGYSDNTEDIVVDPEKDKTMAIAAYITWIGFIISFQSDSKNSTFTKFHLNQSLIINIVITICVLFVPLIGSLIILVFVVFWVMGIVSAIHGEMKPLPLIGNLKLIK